MYMRRVDGRKVTRLTPGDLALHPGGALWSVRSQPEPYEAWKHAKGLREVRRSGA
jgi:hypothetical protein